MPLEGNRAGRGKSRISSNNSRIIGIHSPLTFGNALTASLLGCGVGSMDCGSERVNVSFFLTFTDGGF